MSVTTDSSRIIKTDNTTAAAVAIGSGGGGAVNASSATLSINGQPILTTAAKSSVSSSFSSSPSLSSLSSSSSSLSSSSVTSSPNNKKSRNSKNDNLANNDTNSNNSNFLPIAPQAFFQPATNHHQGLALASVQQQLQPGSVVFTSPTMAMATLAGAAGPQATVHQQQGTPPGTHGQTLQHHSQQPSLVVNGAMTAPQFSTGTFQTANGQLIQTTPGMQMMGGLPTQVQVIGANGQPAAYFPQFYTAAGQMQPMLLNNLTMAIPTQNPGQSLAIQLPTNAPNASGTTMIATTGQMTHQAANQTTPVKSQTNQTTIVKGVTISPQQQQASKTSASSGISNGGKTNQSAQPQPGAQQAIIQQTTTFQQNATNQTFLIGLPNSGHQQNGTTILPTAATTSTSARKTTNSGRSNNGNKGSNLIQKIQPATSPLLTQAQFKPNTSFGGATTVTNSPAAGQTIMVHGQSIQPGPTGSIQLTNQPTIISPLTSFQAIQPSITWATSPQLNQQSAQLVAPNGQILIRTQGPNDSPHMLIQTSNNQFQAVPMQMTSTGTQQQNQAGGGMQVTPTGQPTMMTAPSINSSLPISIQTNQGVAAMSSTTMVNTQQTNNTNTMTSNMLTVVSSSSNTSTLTTSATMASAIIRQRPLRPASSSSITQQQSTISTQTTTTKPKTMESNHRTSHGTNVPKLAPKGVSSAITSVTNTNLSKNQQQNGNGKLPLPALPKTTQADPGSHGIISTVMSTNTLSLVNKTSIAKINTSTQSVNSSSIVGTSSVTSSTASSVLELNSQNNNLVSGTTSNNKFECPFSSKLNRKQQTEKKDVASSTENKSLSTSSINSNKSIKTNMTSIRNTNNNTVNKSTGLQSQSNPMLPPPNLNLFSTNSNQSTKNNAPSQTMNGPQTTNKNPPMNGITKTNSSNTITSNNATSNNKVINNSNNNKSKQNDPNNQVLTHIIDGYIIQESANPFPVNGFLTLSEFDNMNQNGGEDALKKIEVEHKENGQNVDNNKDAAMIKPKENGLQNAAMPQQQTTSQTQLPPSQSILSNVHKMNDLCTHCGKNERMQNAKKKKWKKYCQTCIDKFLKKQQQGFNNVAVGAALSLSSTQASTPALSSIGPVNTTSSSTTTSIFNGLGMSVHLAENQSNQLSTVSAATTTTTNTSSQRSMSIMKRPLNQTTLTTTANDQAIKRQRFSSSNNNQIKSVIAQVNNSVNGGDSCTIVSNGNGISGVDGKVDSANNNNEGDKMWLPAGGTKEPSKWTVQEVYEFMSHLEGCADLAEGFKTQEIDGQALMLIKEDHIIDILNTKLGPALKICRKIKELKDEFNY